MTSRKKSSNLIPIFSQLFAPYDQLIGEKSLQAGMQALRDTLFGQPTIRGLSLGVRKALKSKPGVIVCNHPFDTEVILLLSSLPDRKDVAMIGADSQVRMGKEFAKYIFKVYPFHQEREGKDLKFSSRVARYTYRKDSGLTDEEMRQKNKQAISQAASFVDRGGLVIMFPQGTSSKNIWRPGIGHLLSQIATKNVNLYMVYIKGTTNLDFFRFLPGLNSLLPRPTVTFRKPILLKKEKMPKEAKEIASFFQEEYVSWIRTLRY